MIDQLRIEPDAPCPKLLRVLEHLLDDEALEEFEALPTSIQLHLSRCPACRQSAERILEITDGLSALSTLEPTNDLEDRAEAQAIKGLRAGGRLTGRVDLGEEVELELSPPRPFPLMKYARWAVAASVGFFLVVYGVSQRDSSGPVAATPTVTPMPRAFERSDPEPALGSTGSTLAGGGAVTAPSPDDASEPAYSPRLKTRKYSVPVPTRGWTALPPSLEPVRRPGELPDPLRRHVRFLIDRNLRRPSTVPKSPPDRY